MQGFRSVCGSTAARGPSIARAEAALLVSVNQAAVGHRQRPGHDQVDRCRGACRQGVGHLAFRLDVTVAVDGDLAVDGHHRAGGDPDGLSDDCAARECRARRDDPLAAGRRQQRRADDPHGRHRGASR